MACHDIVEKLEIHVCFGGVVRRRWPIDGPAFPRELHTTNVVDRVREFAAATFVRAIDEWLYPTLGLRPGDVETTGVELQFVDVDDDDERRLCGVSVSPTGVFVFHPEDPVRFEAGARAVNDIAWSASTPTARSRSSKSRSNGHVATLRCHIRLTPLDDDTWGSSFRREIIANVLWSRSRLGRAADAVSHEALASWVASLRRADDPDGLAMATALIDDVRVFLLSWPRSYTKVELGPWKRFVTEVVGRELDVLLAFCPRWIDIQGRRVSSSAIDPLGPTPDDVVSRILLEVDNASAALRKPRFSPKLMVGVVDASRVACAPETVLRLRAGKEFTPTHFYVDETARDDIASFVDAREYALVKHRGTRKYAIMGVATRVERWEVDHRVIVEFVSRSVLERFDHTIVVGGQTYGCQKNGFVAVHAIARLIKAVQEGRERDASELRGTIERFHAETRLGFPIIGGRKKKVIHFSDYTSEFEYRADKTIAVPEHIVPLSYTEHMSRNLRLYPKRDALNATETTLVAC